MKTQAQEKRPRRIKRETIEAGVYDHIKISQLREGQILAVTLRNTSENTARLLFYIVRTTEPVKLSGKRYSDAQVYAHMQWEGKDDISPEVRIVGSGMYTTKKENPVQTQDRAFSISYNWLMQGKHITFSPSVEGGFEERFVIDAMDEIVFHRPSRP